MEPHEQDPPVETSTGQQNAPPPPPSPPGGAGAPLGPKNPWLAAGLSLFPGMGNAYNGLYLRAVGFFALVVLCIYLADRGHGLWGFGVAFVWIFNVVDAYRQAVLINYGYAEEPALARRLRGKGAVREKLFGGVALLIIGLLELIDRFRPLYLDWIFDLWPVIFIALGAWLIWRGVQAKRRIEGAGPAAETPGGYGGGDSY